MDTDGHGSQLVEGALTHSVLGAAFEFLNTLGHGLREKTYERALVVEFGLRGLVFERQRTFDVFYKDMRVDEFVPDLVVAGKVIVDTKVVDRLGDIERGQMLNYLRITGLEVGLLLNFKRPKLEWERIVL
ncbi:MAG TPA: GxxExxY protein [Opitutus sp.]|nr:GxxExxY protein [Opitutus sp.]